MLIMLFLLFFYPVIFGDKCLNLNQEMWFDTFYFKDKPPEVERILVGDLTPVMISYPYDLFTAREFREGRFPLWNPYNACGVPVLANFQSAPFSIFKIPFYIHPSQKTYDFYYLSILLFAGIFTYLFIRRNSLSVYAGIFGGISFMFSQYMLVRLHMTDIPPAAFLPLMLFSTEGIFTRGWREYFFLSVTMILCISSGHPESVFYVFFAGFLYGIFKSYLSEAGDRNPLIKKVFFIYLLSGITCIFIYSPVILPFLELLLNGATHKFVREYQGLRFIMESSIFRLAHLLQPIFFKIRFSIYEFFFADYPGILSLILAIAGLMHYAWRLPAFILLVFFIPFFNILSIFFSISFNYLYLTPLYTMGIIIYASRLLDSAEIDKHLTSRLKIIFIILVILSAAFTVPAVLYYLKVSGAKVSSYSFHFLFRMRPVLFVWIPLGLLIWKLHRVKSMALRKALLILIAFWDLYIVSQFTPLRNNCFEYYLPPTLEFTQSQKAPFRGLSMMGATLPANTNLVFGIPNIRWAEAISIRRYTEFLTTIDPSIKKTGKMIPNTPDLTYWDLLNVKYIFSSKCSNSGNMSFCEGGNIMGIFPPQEIRGERFKKIIDSDYYSIYENLTGLPRAFMVYSAEFVRDENEALGLIKSGWQDFRNSVIIEDKNEGAGRRGFLNQTPANDVEFELYEPQRVRLRVKTDSAGFLVLSDIFYPGWRAYIDKEESKIFPADYLIRAVFLEPGEHIVEFRYEPASFRIGLVISIISAIGFLMVGFVYLISVKKIKRATRQVARNNNVFFI